MQKAKVKRKKLGHSPEIKKKKQARKSNSGKARQGTHETKQNREQSDCIHWIINKLY